MAKKSDQTRMWTAVIPGVILIAIGVIFLLNNYGITTIDFGNIWPVFIIIPGIYMLFGGHHRKD